jgi:uncharacterized tellurite resistance protein B-like protein
MIVRLAVALMAADGRITQSELSTAEHLDRLGLGALSTLAKEEIDRAARQPIDLGDTCTGLAELSPEGGRIILSILAEIAAADGVVTSTEREMLREIAGLLTLPAGSADDALASLELGPLEASRPSRHHRPRDQVRVARRTEARPGDGRVRIRARRRRARGA